MRHRVSQGAALALSGWLLVACSSGGSPVVESVPSVVSSSSVTSSSAAPSSSAASSPTSSSAAAPLFSSAAPTTSDAIPAPEAANRAAAEAAWTRYWEVYATLPHTPEDQWDGLLVAVAVEPMITNAKTDARSIVEKGRDTYGTVTHRFSWAKPINDSDTATISDCDDTSQSGAYETATGNKISVGVPRRNTMGTLVKGSDGIWRVSAAYILKDEPC